MVKCRGQICPVILQNPGMDTFCSTEPLSPGMDTLILLWTSKLVKMSLFGKTNLQFQACQLTPKFRHRCRLTKAFFVLLTCCTQVICPTLLSRNSNGTPKFVVFRDYVVLTLSPINPTFTGFTLLCGQFVLPSFGHLSYPTLDGKGNLTPGLFREASSLFSLFSLLRDNVGPHVLEHFS